jgi:hypothetical protein
VSALYQDAARVAGADLGVAPVHLDAVWWGGPRTSRAAAGQRPSRTAIRGLTSR